MSDESEDFSLDLDFTGVSREGGSFTLLPEGKYELTVTDLQKKPSSKGPDAPKVVHVSYEVDDAHPMDWFSLHPKAVWNFRNWLETLTGMEFDGPLTINKQELIGMKIGAYVTVQDNPGKFDFDEDGNKTPKKMNVIETYFRV